MKCGVGNSSKKDVSGAAEEALNKMKRGLGAESKADIMICFSSVSYDQKALVKAISECDCKANMIGCSDAGNIVPDGPFKNSVALMGISSEKIKFTTGIGKGIDQDPKKAGSDLANAIKTQDPNVKLVIMMADGLAGNGADIVRGVLSVMGDKFPVVGGSAGDDFLFKQTYEYLNGEVTSNDVVGLGLSGDFAFGIGVRHGWAPIGTPMKVTKSKGAVVYELDGKPAVKIYEDYFGEEKAGKLREEPLARLAITYPLGMETPESDEFLIRDPITVGEDGSITCAAEIPEGVTLRLMIGSKEEAIEAARMAAQQAVGQMKGKEVKAAIIFNCIARDKLFGRDAKKEIEAIKDVIGKKVPLIGFYTYGEQAPIAGKIHACSSVFHNETVVILTLGE
ncbi:MAG: FIST N-terminal domain-containing protein [Candidatus Margulisiibacteriota bacterium]